MKIIKFIKEVRSELNKISWLSGKEAMVSSLMVVVAVLIFALLFVLTDFIIYHSVQFFMNLGV